MSLWILDCYFFLKQSEDISLGSGKFLMTNFQNSLEFYGLIMKIIGKDDESVS